MKVIAHFRDPAEGHMARSILESSGLHPTLLDEHYVGNVWLHSQAVGGVRLAIPETEEADALEILAAPPSPEEEGPEEVRDRAAAVCPDCRSVNLRRDGWSHRFRALAVFSLLFVPLTYLASDWVCGDCGSRWRGR